MNLPKKTEKGSVFVVKAVKVKENIYWVGGGIQGGHIQTVNFGDRDAVLSL